MKLIIDGDACPVKEEIYSLANEYNKDVILVSNFSHFSTKPLPSNVERLYVDSGQDSADYRIVAIAKEGDVVITQDYGLASLLLQKNCIVLHHEGTKYSLETIDQLLASREISNKLRKSGMRTKGPKPFTDEKRKIFSTELKNILEKTTKKDDKR